MPTPIDITNQRFGRLVAITQGRKPNGERAWECLCDCGVTVVVSVKKLRFGHTSSCGCLHKERFRAAATLANTQHGLWKTPEYQSWNGIRNRCLSPNNRSYFKYGGRGITVCERWAQSFPAFLADMGPKPSAQHSVERIDNNGPYEPGNCRWATKKEQANNRRSSIRLTVGGVTQTVTQWSEATGIPYTTLRNRIYTLGWDPERAISTTGAT